MENSGGGDPYASFKFPAGLQKDSCHFLSSSTTREQEELTRRKAEHMEAIETLNPFGSQYNFAIPSFEESKPNRYKLL